MHSNASGSQIQNLLGDDQFYVTMTENFDGATFVEIKIRYIIDI